MAEWGYISMDELEDIVIGFVEVDRDIHWKIRKAIEVNDIARAHRWQTKPNHKKGQRNE